MEIISKKALTLVEAEEYLTKSEEKRPIDDYFKEFVKVSKEDAKKMIDEINSLNNPKIKEEYTVKIVDFMPKDSEDVNKIFVDAGLNEEEINSILTIVNKY